MTVRIIVLGAGRIGAMHAEMLAHRVPGASLAGVFDLDRARAAEIGARLQAPALSSLDEALAASADAVAICTSTDSHIDTMVAAASAGRAIFCEKPLSLDLDDVDRGLAAVDAAGVALQVGFNRRYDPAHRAVAEAVRDGSIGDVHLCRITSRDPAPPPIDYLAVSGGIFNDMTIHDFDMARHLTGSEVDTVYATGAVRVDPAIGAAGDLDTVAIVLTHENGAITTIDNSRQAVYGYDQRVEVFGSAGMACSDNLHQHAATIAGSGGFRQAPLEHFFLERYEQSYLAQWATFVEVVATGRPSPVDGRDGRAPLLIADAALRSHREGRAIAVRDVTEGTSS